ncbi:MAG: hypothetical protein ACTSP4_15915 [Candidatus Hodarchaeales archaeon]
MSIIEKIVSYLEEVKESSITDMIKVAEDLDRNRISGYLRACEELGILEKVGKASHSKYRLKKNYSMKLEYLNFKVTKLNKTDETRKTWYFPHKKRLKKRTITWSSDLP